MNEIERTWKMYPVKGYEYKYDITSTGEIWSWHMDSTGNYREEPLAVCKGKEGYPNVKLCKDGKKTTYTMHQLMAETFIPNPDNKPEINHKNGNKSDYSLDNLEWATRSENIQHAYETGLIDKTKLSKAVLDQSRGIIYTSISEASKACNISYSTCKNYLNGNRKNPTSLILISK